MEQPKQEINTIYGTGKYSHTETDSEFYAKGNTNYSYKNGYAVIHRNNAHDIYILVKEV